MNKSFCGGLVAAVVASATVFQASVVSAGPIDQPEEGALQSDSLLSDDTSIAVGSGSLTTQPVSSAISESISASATAEKSLSESVVIAPEDEDLAFGLSELVRIIPHDLDDAQAATLLVKDIPVLTFVANETTDETTGEAAIATPVSRATSVARRVDEFYQSEGNATAIHVRWDADLEEYIIDVADNRLVLVNEATILPDTTASFAEDALQATNRLRRLLGGAEPLTVVEGQPEPEEPELPPAQPSWQPTAVFTGQASWYGPGFHGRRTASGEVFNQNAMTAAHRTLPFGTSVRVTNLNNGRQVIVRINDRGPFSGGRILDLSAASARAIGLHSTGVGPIQLEVLN